MNSSNEIPNDIPKDYFDLHEDIKDVSGFYPLEAFNKETFEDEYKSSLSRKKSYYLNVGLSLAASLSSVFVGIYLMGQIQFLAHHSKEASDFNTALVNRNYAGTLVSIGVILACYGGYKAYKALKSFTDDEKSKLLRNAHHHGIAQQIYHALEIIISDSIPVFTLSTKRPRLLPIHTMLGSRKNVMLALLGDENHRQALLKDGRIAIGPILIEKKYRDAILGNLERSIRDVDKTSIDERDPRALKTALLHKKHMNSCYKVMSSETYWAGKRKKKKIIIIMAFVKILLDDWDTWEKFRKNITGNITKAKLKDNEFHSLYKKLSDISDSNEELISILAGDDRTARKFFRSLKAISEQDLVSRKRPIS